MRTSRTVIVVALVAVGAAVVVLGTPVLTRTNAPPAAPEPPPAATGRRIVFYRHPMRPDVISAEPAKDEMGMDYVPVYEEETVAASADVPGHAAFTLSPARQQLIGVTTDTVQRRELTREIRAAGRVAYDPRLYQAIVEYRQALAAQKGLENSQWQEAHDTAAAIVRASVLKLRQLGISPQQLASLAEERHDPVNLLVPGKTVWVYAQVYEYEMDLVRPGQALTVTARSLPGKSYAARIAAVDPILDAATRSVRVRAEIPNPDGLLRAEMFVTVHIGVPLGRVLAIPDSAVLRTGERQMVFVVEGEGTFTPRPVTLGREAEGYAEVLSGVREGERVVTSANFLIDSESRFRAALAAFSRSAGEPSHPR